MQPGPLVGLTVVDFTRVLAGPYCTLLLAELGARVIKIERPDGGDDARAFGPFLADGSSAYFSSLNRGKESIALDLRAPADRDILDRLLGRADVLVENFRPGALDRLGLGWDDLHPRFPRLIFASVSGFGATGPYAERPAYDLVVQAMGGLMSLTGHAGGPPIRVGTSIGDIAAGLFAAVGIVSAVVHRAGGGEAMRVDVGMLDCQVAILENALARFAATGVTPAPLGARHPSVTPFDAFAAADGPVVICAGNDALFAALAAVLGREDLARDPRFATNDARTLHHEALKAEIEAALKSAPGAQWLARLHAAGVPCGPINTIDAVARDPHVAARNMLVEAAADDRSAEPAQRGGGLTMAGNPIKLSGFADPGTRRPAPALDADRAAVLRLAGDPPRRGR
jgi:CoA:oxalate CoA-transferase